MVRLGCKQAEGISARGNMLSLMVVLVGAKIDYSQDVGLRLEPTLRYVIPIGWKCPLLWALITISTLISLVPIPTQRVLLHCKNHPSESSQTL